MDPKSPNAKVRIETKMLGPMREILKQFLVEHIDMFAWSHEDISVIDNIIIEHNFCVNSDNKKVKHKRSAFSMKVEVKVDSQMVINQVLGEYEAKGKKFKMYLQLVLGKKDLYCYFSIL